MSSVSPKNPVELCRSCGQILDISAMLPLSVVACPVCSTATTVLRYVGPFQLERIIGQGGMGAVYQASDIGLRRSVALKVLNRSWSQDEKVTAQFEREAALTARVNHPNVVRVYSSGLSHGIFYIAMELVTDGSLEKWMAQEGRLSELEVVRAGIQVAQGLLSAQNAGLIHRDIKPANILFAEGRIPKIVDFGLALQSSETSLQRADSEVWGTPDYIAPESLEFKSEDFRSDIYALGATLWHALTGSPPHQVRSTSIREILQIKRKPVDLVRVMPKAHPGTVRALNRALAFHPEDRHPNYLAFISELQSALHALEPHSHQRPSVSALAWLRTPKAALALGMLVLGGASAALWKINSAAHFSDSLRGEAVVSEETRLLAALRLMASGKLPEAAAILEKLLRVHDMPPRTEAWCRLALTLIYGADGQTERRQYLLQTLTTTVLKEHPALAQWFRKLPGVATQLQPPDPAASVSQIAIHHLCHAVLELNQKQWTQAQKNLALALQQTIPPTEPEAAALLGFARWIEADLQTLQQSLAQLENLKKNPTDAKFLTLAENLSKRLTLVQPIRAFLQSSLLRARSDAAKATAAQAAAKASAASTPTSTPSSNAPAPTTSISPTSPIPFPAPPPSAAPDPNPAIPPERLEALRKETADLFSQFLFGAALKKCQEFAAASPAQATAANPLVPLLKTSSIFFEWAIREINRGQTTFPYPPLRSGAPFPAKPVRADAQKVVLQTENGSSAEMPWNQIAPAYLLSIANARLSQIQDPLSRAEILWMAGNFQILAGSREKGLATLKQAADLNPNYMDGFKFLMTNP